MEEGVSLSRFTTLGTGGPARWFARPETVDDLHDALQVAAERNIPAAPVGLGSNLLVADEGFEGLALKLGGELAKAEARDGLLVAGGGAPLAVCLHRARAAGLGGIEFACAIPGTAGGAVWMNAGAYGGDVAGVLERALVVDAEGTAWRTPEELGLTYRRSGLGQGQVVAQVELRLEPRPVEEIKATVARMQAQRKAAQPTNRRTFGSVFKNPDHELSAGRMLEACGLRGFAHGGARISPKHANFIENDGDARSADAVALIAEARRRALDEFGVRLEPEVQLLGPIAIPPLRVGPSRAAAKSRVWTGEELSLWRAHPRRGRRSTSPPCGGRLRARSRASPPPSRSSVSPTWPHARPPSSASARFGSPGPGPVLPPTSATRWPASTARASSRSTRTRSSGGFATCPTIRDARVDRAFPHALAVDVVPERPLAVVRDGKRAWLVAESGRVVAPIEPTARPRLARIRVELERTPAVGGRLETDEAQAALTVLRAVPRRFPARVVLARVEEGGSCSWSARGSSFASVRRPIWSESSRRQRPFSAPSRPRSWRPRATSTRACPSASWPEQSLNSESES